MVNNISNFNVSIDPLSLDFWTNIPPEIISRMELLINIAKAAGIIFIIYLIYVLIRGFLNIKRNKRIDKTYKKVKLIDKKLDVLLGKKRLKELEKELENKRTEAEKKKKKKTKKK